MNSNNPTFLGLGAEKSATSWIFSCLYQHPDICIPVKEINFFSIDEKWKKGRTWYTDLFDKRCSPNNRARGEFSTEYFHDEIALKRIYEFLPEVKLILSLRDPIERAYSGYMNDIKAGSLSKKMTFNEALSLNPDYLRKSHYKSQLKFILTKFPESQILLMIYEDIFLNPRAFIQKTYSFIGVNSSFIPQGLYQRINSSRTPTHHGLERTMNYIAEAMANSKYFNRIWWNIRQSRVPRYVRSINTRGRIKTNIMDPKVYNQLIDTFQDDKVYIENYMNRKLNWLVEKKV